MVQGKNLAELTPLYQAGSEPRTRHNGLDSHNDYILATS